MEVEELNEERKRQKLSVAELAEKANLPKGTVEKVLFGVVKNPRIDTMQAINRALGLYTSPQTKKGLAIEDEVELNDIYPIKIIGEVAAGIPLEEQENIEGVIYISYRPPEEYFSVRVHGDSMKGIGLLDRDVLIVHKQPTVESGEICVAMVNGKQTVKRFKQYGANFFLMPENPEYEPIPLNPGDDVIILGKVVEWRHIL